MKFIFIAPFIQGMQLKVFYNNNKKSPSHRKDRMYIKAGIENQCKLDDKLIVKNKIKMHKNKDRIP